MRFGSALSTASDLKSACREAAARAAEPLHGETADLCVAFVSPRFADAERAPALLARALSPRVLVGCSGEGLIGGGREVEGRPAVSVTVASMPGVELRAVHLEDRDLPDEDAPPAAWVDAVGLPAASAAGFVVLPEPFTFSVDRLLAGLDFAYPRAPKVGGIASGSRAPGGHALFCGARTHQTGGVVLGLCGDVVVETRVAQGCRPFGKVGRITGADTHRLETIDKMPAMLFLQEQLGGLSSDALERASRTPLFLGIAMDPFAVAEPAAGDFLIRNVMGCDPATGTLSIGDVLSVGRPVQFHLRDREASSQDLREVLERGRRDSRRAVPPRGALLFSCLGRGRHLYGEEGHDSRLFAAVVGPVALGGFFCNGEIGPVGGNTYLHGYTSSFALFSELPA